MNGWYIMYGKNDCSFCTDAETLFHEIDATVDYRNIETSSSWRAKFKEELPGVTTVPQIFYNDDFGNGKTYIGGYRELLEWVNKHYTRN